MYEKFRTIRQHFGLSQSQFAKSINRTISFVSNVENGRCGVSKDTVNAICSTYGINQSWLTEGVGEMFAAGCKVSEADKENAGDRVKLIRKREQLTQEQFGKAIGYGKMQVFAVEKKKTIPSNKFLRSVSDAYHVSYKWILTGEGEIEEKPNKAVVDNKLVEWLENHPDVVKELRIRGGLD